MTQHWSLEPTQRPETQAPKTVVQLRNQMLQGDAYTSNWLSAIRHTKART